MVGGGGGAPASAERCLPHPRGPEAAEKDTPGTCIKGSRARARQPGPCLPTARTAPEMGSRCRRTQPGGTRSAVGGKSATCFFTSFLLESDLLQVKRFQAQLLSSGFSRSCYGKRCHRSRAVAKLSLTGVTQPSILLRRAAFSQDGPWLWA